MKQCKKEVWVGILGALLTIILLFLEQCVMFNIIAIGFLLAWLIAFTWEYYRPQPIYDDPHPLDKCKTNRN